MAGSSSYYTIMATDPYRPAFEQARLHSAQWNQPQEAFRLDVGDHRPDFVGVCRDDDVRCVRGSFACCREVAHVIYRYVVHQRGKETAKSRKYGLFRA